VISYENYFGFYFTINNFLIDSLDVSLALKEMVNASIILPPDQHHNETSIEKMMEPCDVDSID